MGDVSEDVGRRIFVHDLSRLSFCRVDQELSDSARRVHILALNVANGPKSIKYQLTTVHGEMNRFLMTKATREMRVVLKTI